MQTSNSSISGFQSTSQSKKKVFGWLFGLLLLIAEATSAGERRLERDMRVDLAELKASNKVVSRIDHVGPRYEVDASAVLVGTDIEKLRRSSMDFDRYVAMGMPNLRASHTVGRSGDLVYVWSEMSTAGQTSKHYLEVHPVADGSFWNQVTKRPEWAFEQESSFKVLDGSWYMEPQSDGSVYVRYFMSAEFDTSVPDFIVAMVARRQVPSGIRQVVRTIAKDAGARIPNP